VRFDISPKFKFEVNDASPVSIEIRDTNLRLAG
jgi:hypothetical protein